MTRRSPACWPRRGRCRRRPARRMRRASPPSPSLSATACARRRPASRRRWRATRTTPMRWAALGRCGCAKGGWRRRASCSNAPWPPMRQRRSGWRPALDGASYAAELAEARAQMQRNELERAEATLRRALARDVPDRADAEALLGDLLAAPRRSGGLAEQRYRAALARRPDFGAALAGLNRALAAQGRTAEAAEIARRLPPPPGAPGQAAPPPCARKRRARAIRPRRRRCCSRRSPPIPPTRGCGWISPGCCAARAGRARRRRSWMRRWPLPPPRPMPSTPPPCSRRGGGAAAGRGRTAAAHPAGAPHAGDGAPACPRPRSRPRWRPRRRGCRRWQRGSSLLALAARPDPTWCHRRRGGCAPSAPPADARGAAEAARHGPAGHPRHSGAAGHRRRADRGRGGGGGPAPRSRRCWRCPGCRRRNAARRWRCRTASPSGSADLANERGDQAEGFEHLRPLLDARSAGSGGQPCPRPPLCRGGTG